MHAESIRIEEEEVENTVASSVTRAWPGWCRRGTAVTPSSTRRSSPLRDLRDLRRLTYMGREAIERAHVPVFERYQRAAECGWSPASCESGSRRRDRRHHERSRQGKRIKLDKIQTFTMVRHRTAGAGGVPEHEEELVLHPDERPHGTPGRQEGAEVGVMRRLARAVMILSALLLVAVLGLGVSVLVAYQDARSTPSAGSTSTASSRSRSLHTPRSRLMAPESSTLTFKPARPTSDRAGPPARGASTEHSWAPR